MDVQYIFGNPTSKKKKRGKKVASTETRKKSKKRKTTSKRRKQTKKKRTKKNPQKVRMTLKNKKTKKKVSRGTTGWFPKKSEIKQVEKDIAKLREKKRVTKTRDKKRSLQNKINVMKDNLSYMKLVHKAGREEVKDFRKKAREAGDDYAFSTEYDMKPARRRKKKKKTRRKKVARKKKTTRRKSASKKKKSTRRKSASKKRKTTKKRKSASKKRKSTKKRRKSASNKRKTRSKSRRRWYNKKGKKKAVGTVTKTKSYKKPRKVKRVKTVTKVYRNPKKRRNPIIRTRSNPMKVAGFKVAGYEAMELAELGVGGAVYGLANSYITPMFQRIPGLGPMANMLGGTMPTLVSGVLLNMVSDKIKNRQMKQALEFLGDGLLGAAVVGAGVSASQMIPGLTPMEGINYTPGHVGIPGAASSPDFGHIDYTPELGHGHYAQQLGDVQMYPGPNLPGQNLSADFGEYQQSAADFGHHYEEHQQLGVEPTGMV